MSKFFIRRPIVAIVIAILTTIIGLVSMLTLPTAQYPDIAPPEIQVQANYAGADAKTLLQAVSTPLEQQITGVDNMLYMYSVNANNGQSQIFVDFDVKTNPDTDQILTQLRVSQAQAQLPAASDRGRHHCAEVANFPTDARGAFIAKQPVRCDVPDKLRNHQAAGRDHPCPGRGARASLWRAVCLARLGAAGPASEAWSNRARDHRGTADTEQRESSRPGGRRSRAEGSAVYLHCPHRRPARDTPDEFGKIVVRANADGSVVHLSDVARIEMGLQYYTLNGRYNKAPAGVFGVYQLPGSNAVEVAKLVNQRMAELCHELPSSGLKYDVPLDTTKAVTAGLHEIVLTLVRSPGSGRHRGVHLPAGMARNADSFTGRARLA